MLATSYRTAYNEDHEAFRDTVRKVFAEHLTPYMEEHEANGIVPRDVMLFSTYRAVSCRILNLRVVFSLRHLSRVYVDASRDRLHG